MKASELRIGNYIQSKEEEGNHVEFMEITAINSNGTGYYNSYNRRGFRHPEMDDMGWFSADCELKGMKCTPLRLIKLGFSEASLLKRILDTDLYLQGEISGKKCQVYISTDIGHGKSSDPNAMIEGFKYIHQVQNLYFALTGRELTYI